MFQPMVAQMAKFDWRDCDAVEVVEGKVSGQPVIRHSRVRPDDLVENRDQGEDWLARNHGIPVQTVREVLTFWHRHHRGAPNPS